MFYKQVAFLFIVKTVTAFHHAIWLDAACTADGLISAINPDPSAFNAAYAYSKGGDSCDIKFSEDLKNIEIWNCQSLEYTIHVVLYKSVDGRPAGASDGRHKRYWVTCNLSTYVNRAVKIDFISILNRTNVGSASFPNDIDPNDLTFTSTLMDQLLYGGYTQFTIGYPVVVLVKGSTHTSFRPEECTAYRGIGQNRTMKGTTILRNGCSTYHDVIFNFTSDYVDYFDRNLTGVNPVLTFEDDFLSGRNENVDDVSEPPILWTNLYAFKFAGSNQITVECSFIVCKEGHPECESKCQTSLNSNQSGRSRSKRRVLMEPPFLDDYNLDDDDDDVTDDKATQSYNKDMIEIDGLSDLDRDFSMQDPIDGEAMDIDDVDMMSELYGFFVLEPRMDTEPRKTGIDDVTKDFENEDELGSDVTDEENELQVDANMELI